MYFHLLSLFLLFLILFFFIYLFFIPKRENMIQLRLYQKLSLAFHEEKLPSKQENLKSLSKIPQYYINLDSSEDRREHIQSMFQNYHLPIPKRIPAIDGHSLLNLHSFQTEQFQYEIKSIPSPYNSKELACTLSHIIAIYNALLHGNEMAIIFEDDISLELVPYWIEPLDVILQDATTFHAHWDIIQLGSLSHSFYYDTLKWNQMSRYGAFAYLIHRRGMEKIISSFMPNPYQFRFENVEILADILLYKHTITLLPNRIFFIPFNQNSLMNSTIHTDHTYYHCRLTFHKAKQLFIHHSSTFVHSYPVYKVLHILCLSHSSVDKILSMYKKLYPLWKLNVYHEKDSMKYWNAYFPKDKHDQKEHLLPILFVYLFGGFAIHHQFIPNLEDIVTGHDLVLSIRHKFIYASKKHHPFLKFYIDSIHNQSISHSIKQMKQFISKFQIHFKDPIKYLH